MPNAKVLEEKKALVASLVEKIKNAPAGVLVDYKGINVEDDTKLRRELRAAGVDYAVIKNTMIRFAAKELGFELFEEHLNGTTALAISTNDDVVSAAKILNEYAKKHDNFKIKAGYLEGEAIPASEVLKLAEMPSREGLIAQVLYGFNFPITQLVIALDNIAKKTEDGEALVSTLVAPKEAAAEETAAE
jgi:large subunit ribosomal protein L10